jgi:deoxyribodipyrimidine photo-lyase
MTVAIALFTADLRTHDSPVLRGALDAADQVVPLFVLDDRVRAVGFAAPSRSAFLAASLADLDETLRELGGHLVVRAGDVVHEVCRVAEEADAAQVHVAGDVSGFAQHREERLRTELAKARRELRVHADAPVVVPPGAVTPADRLGLGVLRDDAPPHRAAAGDGDAAPGALPHPAHRRTRRAALPRRPRRTAARGEPLLRHGIIFGRTQRNIRRAAEVREGCPRGPRTPTLGA